MHDILLSPVPLSELKAELKELFKQELNDRLSTLSAPKAPDDFLTRKQAAALLSVSLPTLHEWTKEGRIVGYRIASRVRYRRSELEASLKQIHSSKQRR